MLPPQRSSMSTKLYMWLGIETATWTGTDFINCIDYCKKMGFDGVLLKIYEITQGEWYNGSVDTYIQLFTQAGLDCIPYGYFYMSNPVQEIAALDKYLQKYPVFCIDAENQFLSNASSDVITGVLHALAYRRGKAWVTTFADPIEQQWGNLLATLIPYVDQWIPQAYSGYLVSTMTREFTSLNSRVIPAYSVIDINTMKPFDPSQLQVYSIVTLWEYTDALNNESWIKQFVALMKGVVTVTQQWFEYPICVPFGNPAYDSGLGGSHDMDVQTPPNTHITSIVSGVVCDLSSPSWGKQVGIKLDTPYNNIPYFAYLHLSAIDPTLTIGKHVAVGDSIGWSGGCTSASQYNGTSNPTGSNFLNDPSMSSQPQTGIALMRGPSYGSGTGWVVFPPIDTALDPTGILEGAINRALNPSTPVLKVGLAQQMQDTWNLGYTTLLEFAKQLNLPLPPVVEPPPFNTGIAAIYQRLYPSYNLGTPIGGEITTVDTNGNPMQLQLFTGGFVQFWRDASPGNKAGKYYVYNWDWYRIASGSGS